MGAGDYVNSWPVFGNISTTATNTILTNGTTTYAQPGWFYQSIVTASAPEPEKPKRAKAKPADPLAWLHDRVDEYVALGQLD